MSRQVVIAVFADDRRLLGAARAARGAGLRLLDAYTPHPVHGLETALGLGPSRIPLVAFFCGLGGLVFMLWFQFWTTAVDWRLNVGGRPWNSSLAFLAVTFEVMVLAAGLGSVVALLVAGRLRPGRVESVSVPGVTDDRYALVLERPDARLDPAEVTALLAAFEPSAVEDHWLEEER